MGSLQMQVCEEVLKNQGKPDCHMRTLELLQCLVYAHTFDYRGIIRNQKLISDILQKMRVMKKCRKSTLMHNHKRTC